MKLLCVCFAAGLLFAACASGPAADAPLRMIIETDMGNDIDDALALAVALRAVDDGKVQLLAVGCHKYSPTAAAYTDSVCAWYGHPEVQVAMSRTPVREFSDYTDYTAVTGSSAREYPEPVELYRRLLSESPDHSVLFVSLGFGTTLAQLLEADRGLVARKTVGLSVMAGSYGEKQRAEYNVVNDIPAMQKVFSGWPTTIWQNPFEIGKQAMYPGLLIEGNLGYDRPNPVVEAYKAYKPMPYDRPSWDILSVLYPLRPDLFTCSEPGTVTVDGEGYTWFEPSKDGRHFVLSATEEQAKAIMDAEQSMTCL